MKMALEYIDEKLYREVSLEWKRPIRWTNNSRIQLGEEASLVATACTDSRGHITRKRY